jgi:hypothetical protein
VSQPLTGLVRRRLPDLGGKEAILLFALADMIEKGTREWRDTWAKLGKKVGLKKCPREVRKLAYKLRDRSFIEIRNTGRGILIKLTPESGLKLPTQSGLKHPTQSGLKHPTLTPPLIIPPENAPVTQPGSKVESQDIHIQGGSCNRSTRASARAAPLEFEKNGSNPKPKPKAAPPAPTKPKRRRLSTTELISTEREISRLTKEVDRVRDKHESTEDWSDRERENVKRWKSRVDQLCVTMGAEPLYHATRGPHQ